MPIFWVSRRLKPGTEGIAVWLWAIYPSVIVVSDLNWTQALSALLVALILWAAFRVQDAPRPVNWILYGFLWGFACLLNPAIFAAMPFVFPLASVDEPP